MSDEALRVASLEALGEHGPELARDALERGSLSVCADRLTWEGTAGTMHGDVVVLSVPGLLSQELAVSPIAVDALEKAVGAALGRRNLRSLVELRVEVGPERMVGSPYRG